MKFFEPEQARKVLLNRRNKEKAIKVFYCCVDLTTNSEHHPCLITDDGITKL